MNAYEQFIPYVYLGVLILLSAVALILLASITKGMLFDKSSDPVIVADKEGRFFFDKSSDPVIVADKEGRFFFDIKDVESVILKRMDGGEYKIIATKKYKHGYWIFELPCESRERGVEMIAAIKSLLPKVETV